MNYGKEIPPHLAQVCSHSFVPNIWRKYAAQHLAQVCRASQSADGYLCLNIDLIVANSLAALFFLY